MSALQVRIHQSSPCEKVLFSTKSCNTLSHRRYQVISLMAAVIVSASPIKLINGKQYSNAMIMWCSSLHIGFLPQECQFDPGHLQNFNCNHLHADIVQRLVCWDDA